MTWSNWDIGWPYIGLGGGLVLIAFLFLTDTMRSRTDVPRLRDPVWLAWATVPMYLLHIFEEYAFDVLGRSNVIVQGVCKMQGFQPYPDCPIPLAYFSTVNISLVWVGAPLAAWIARRNLVIGLSLYGFILANGMLHVVTGLTGGVNSLPGVITGALLFVPGAFWTMYVVRSGNWLSRKALAVSFLCGILGHVYLGACYFLFTGGIVGAGGMVAVGTLVGLMPIALAWLGSRFVGVGDVTNLIPDAHRG